MVLSMATEWGKVGSGQGCPISSSGWGKLVQGKSGVGWGQDGLERFSYP
jgi:hypothetical protein